MLNGVGPVKSTVYNKGYRPLESGEEICADAEERVYIPAGTQDKGLGIYFRGLYESAFISASSAAGGGGASIL